MRYNINGVFGEIDSLPGCSQIGVSHSVYSPEKGRGKIANKLRLEYMQKDLGYDYALCTVAFNNDPQVAILEANGWKRLDFLTSSKTGHCVFIYGKALNAL